jgi:hypothetical protein
MNSIQRLICALALSAAAPLAQAHDPAAHAKEAAASSGPDCAAMKQMDHSKMNPNDAVMKAMISRCGDAMDRNSGDHSQAGKPGTAAAPQHDHHGSH